MKIIKKVSVLALSALLMLGGAACGGPSKNSDSSSSVPPTVIGIRIRYSRPMTINPTTSI